MLPFSLLGGHYSVKTAIQNLKGEERFIREYIQ